MKILKEGKILKDWKITVVCQKNKLTKQEQAPPCEAELEIEEKDLFYVEHTCGEIFGVECPLCGQKIMIRYEQIPRFIIDRCENKK